LLENDVDSFLNYLHNQGKENRFISNFLFSSPILFKQFLLSSNDKDINDLAKIVALELKQEIQRNFSILLTMIDQDISLESKRVNDYIQRLKELYNLFLEFAPDLIIGGKNWPSFPNYPSLGDPKDRKINKPCLFFSFLLSKTRGNFF
jgi:hypothetical protein